MRKEYDFSKAVKNPYVRKVKTPVTIRVDQDTIEYFKALSAKANLPYQTLINSYLADCAKKKRKPVFTWS